MSGALMQGRRRPDGTGAHELDPGDYSRYKGVWYARTPGGPVANLASHDVVGHDDGTVTASPSILSSQGRISWHGYLENGVWREC